MSTLDIAHVRRSGQDIILFPLSPSFGRKTLRDQRAALADLERRANAGGLRGHAAALWHDGSRTRFLGPPQWSGFLSSIGMDWVLSNVNRQMRL